MPFRSAIDMARSCGICTHLGGFVKRLIRLAGTHVNRNSHNPNTVLHWPRTDLPSILSIANEPRLSPIKLRTAPAAVIMSIGTT